MDFIRRLRAFFSQSFQRKLLLFNLLAAFSTTIALFLFLTNNFRAITEFSLAQNSASMEQTVEDYLNKYAQEKAASTWLQIQAAQSNLSVLGQTAQKIVDNYDAIQADAALLNLPLFQTRLQSERGALTSAGSDTFDALIPPALVDDPRAQQMLAASALLNLNMDAIYQANANNAFVYFVGDAASPVTRAYPNVHLAEALGDGLQLLFWKDYFAPNVAGWTRWYTDPELRARVPSPVTVEKPYEDAAGQGLIVSMFYPLWNKQTDTFAGAVGADITLAKIIENILSIRVARTGFAFLMNGAGEIIAMPEAGFKLFDVQLTESQQGGLVYYRGLLDSSTDPAVKQFAATILANNDGLLKLALGSGASAHGVLAAYTSLPPLSNNNYEADSWKIVIVAPEAEIFEALNATHAAITAERLRLSAISLAIVLAFLLAVTLVSIQFAQGATRDLRQLAQAAGQVAAKNYQVELTVKSQDEIGQLGAAFETMLREIRDYTANLEAKVADRTLALKRANDDITRLNEQLKGENLRLGAELDVARRLQAMVLPSDQETQAIHDLDIACLMHPADEVGGDYYDVLQHDGSVFLGIGDVTGHGLPAGVIMLMAQTALLTLSQSGQQDMTHILSVLNSVLYRNIARMQEDKNMTLAVLQYRDREFSVVGQHESLLVCRAAGAVEVVDTANLGLPVGLEENIDGWIAVQRLRLEPGDALVLYTDGVTEAENSRQQPFGLPGLTASLVRHHAMNAHDLLERLMADVYAYIGENPIYDDISMLVIKQKPEAPGGN